MTLSVARTRHYLKQFDLEKLFVEELGWDRHSARLPIQVDGHTFSLHAFAEKRGVQIFECRPDDDGHIPDYATRRKLEKQVTKSAYEHLVIYTDAHKSMQVWQWVLRQPGQPTAYREHIYYPASHSGDSLIQKLESITFPLSEEEGLTLTGVVFRLRDAFDRDKVTKKFYDHFKKEHTAFLKFIKGITEQGDKEWYASLMLNRLMFIYFIQCKGFLDSDPDYLRNRLRAVQQRKGKGKFLSFYRYFLLRLFHEGFALQPSQRSPELEELLGRVPYLNGGLFELHELEQKHTGIDIPDEAFEQLFAFFGQYEWHLDSRPLRNDREINPDVLGYIFEKYINQKQMGAYYTKEDITEYISKNTIVPCLVDSAQKKCAIAFQPESSVWQLLRSDPDRYLYPAMRKGVIDEHGAVIPLPEEVARGIDVITQRGDWNRPADSEYALPTETWREHIARRQRCLEVREKLLSGEVHQINDLITYNLDIRQFAEDAITDCEGPELLRAFYQAIFTVTVLDPTCGSGAFLFAALNILEPLFEACLERMHAFVDDLERSGERHRPEKFKDFKDTLAEIDRHPNRRYFILKSIIINNLYGVDIMEEAVEICKLRLFLKLVAQVDKVKELEPLPDIDFNIRAGNTLVGFVSVGEVRRAAERDSSGQLRGIPGQIQKAIEGLEEEAEIVERAFRKFHEMQTKHSMDAREFASAKKELRDRLKDLAEKLDRYLAGEYRVDPANLKAYSQWRKNHQPFHWFVEFYGIMRRGGFDVVVGNPPWREYSSVKRLYQIRNYSTEPCGNLYGICTERAISLRSENGRMSFIVQLPLTSSSRMETVRSCLREKNHSLHVIPFDDRPGKLFDGLQNCRSTIFVSGAPTDSNSRLFTCGYQRWPSETRAYLFSHIEYARVLSAALNPGLFPKYGNGLEVEIFRKVQQKYDSRVKNITAVRPTKHFIFYQEATRYWVKATIGLPYYSKDGHVGPPAHGRYIYFGKAQNSALVEAILNSSLFYVYFIAYGDCFHLSHSLVSEFPIISPILMDNRIMQLGKNIQTSLTKNAERKTIQTRDGSTIAYDEFYAYRSKHLIDKIDHILAEHYGFTREELDFIVNYDIKYRMGQTDDILDNQQTED